jgi:tripartite-type tricarboxylate transporter receptor subunit TctC
MHTFSKRLAAAAALATILTAPALAAKPYPERPVTLVVGYAAGGATDIVARLMAKSLSEELGQTFVVENKTGANSNIGAEIVSRAAPDGYTLYVGSIANTINRTLYSQLNYDFVKGFEPVGLLATIPNILVVNPKLPVKTVQEYIAYAKKNPGKLTCASSGSGSSIHLSCELFKMQTGTDILHVPYRGSGPAVADLLGGQVDSMFDNLPSSLPHVQADKLRAIGVTSPQRLDSVPGTPTLAESGLPGFEVGTWWGVLAPGKTPKAIVDALNRAVNEAAAAEPMPGRLEHEGASAVRLTPAAFGEELRKELALWRGIAAKSGLQHK